MVRLVGIVLVILGLIFQPLMAAMPIELANQGTDNVATSNIEASAHVDGHANHRDQKVADKAAEKPCHGGATENGSSSEAHDGCITAGNCCGVCVASICYKMIVSSNPQINIPVIGKAENLVLGILSSIFHPPKHA